MEITIDINKMCFRYQLRTEKKFPVIIRGLHSETDLCNIKCDSTGPRHLVHNETFKIKKKINPNNKGSYFTIVRLLLFFVDLEPRANNRHI